MTGSELRKSLRHAMNALSHLDDMRVALTLHNGAEHATFTYQTTVANARKLVIWLVGLAGPNAEIMHRQFLLKHCGDHYAHLRRLEPSQTLPHNPIDREPAPVYKNRVMGPDD